MVIRNFILILPLIVSSVLPGYGQSLPFACAGATETYGVQGMPGSVFFWEVEGGIIVDTIYGLNNDSIVVRWNYDRRDHRITVTEQTEYGCFGIPVGGSVNVTAPVADLADEVICEDDLFTFNATNSYPGAIYEWHDGSNGPTFTTNSEGYVTVKITGANGCADVDSAYLTVNPLPDVSLGPDTTLCFDAVMWLDPGFYSTYEWSTGEISSRIRVDGMRIEPEIVWVKVTDYNNCSASDTMVLKVCDASILFKNMPNTITPGDDGFNNEWIINEIVLFPDAVLEIYDRWGRLVFRTNDISNNWWKGETMSGKELPMDAYFYVIDLKVKGTKPLTGYVNIIR